MLTILINIFYLYIIVPYLYALNLAINFGIFLGGLFGNNSSGGLFGGQQLQHQNGTNIKYNPLQSTDTQVIKGTSQVYIFSFSSERLNIILLKKISAALSYHKMRGL